MKTSRGDASEPFIVYGFGLRIPNTWHVEFDAKATRVKGDVVFSSQMNNRIYLSWGPLDEANKHFKTIEEHRDWGIRSLKRARSVREVSVTDERETVVHGHRALVTQVSAFVSVGLVSRRQPQKLMSSMYFHCPERSRYYVVYSLVNTPGEYPDFGQLFATVTQTLVCHGTEVSPNESVRTPNV